MRFGIREFIFLLVLLAVPALSMLYVFKPRNADINQAKQEVAIKKAQLSKLDEVSARIEDLGLAIEKGRDSIEKIERKLPSQQGVDEILQQVWEIAASSGLVVKSFKSEKPIAAALYMEQPLSINMEGQFDGFYQFLLELENLPRITRMRDLTLARQQGRSSDDSLPEMKAEFTLSIYYEPDAQKSASAE